MGSLPYVCFPYFLSLSEDIALHIISFISYSPYQVSKDLRLDPRGTLSHVLPFVCKYFRHICQTNDLLWKEALSKMVLGEPHIWRAGLESLIDESSGVRSVESPFVRSDIDVETLIDLGAAVLVDRRVNTYEATRQEATPTQQLLRYLVSNFLCFTGPVFFMPGQVRLGCEFGLHLFEPRYRLLIEEVMEGEPQQYKEGVPIPLNKRSTFPQFLYGYHSLEIGSPACIVQVRKCRIYGDRRADVVLVPVAHVWLKSIKLRPSTGNLYEATAFRMNRKATIAVESNMSLFAPTR